jgi:hypothetical protein
MKRPPEIRRPRHFTAAIPDRCRHLPANALGAQGALRNEPAPLTHATMPLRNARAYRPWKSNDA